MRYWFQILSSLVYDFSMYHTVIRLFNYIFLLTVIGASGFFVYKSSLDPCDSVLEYSIGQFDPQFGINQTDFKKYIQESEVPWEREVGKELFRHKEGAKFKVNLVYDNRQIVTEQKRKEEFGLTRAEEILEEWDNKFSILDSKYKSLVSLHEQEANSLEKDQAEHNRKVDYWNKKGGAPEPTFSELEAERVSLNNRIYELNKEAVTLNNTQEELNQLIKSRNDAAANYNKIARSYNEKYGHGLEFNQGEYTSGNINIYQFDSAVSLRMVLAHEFGHALGMDHTEGETSIMNSTASPNRTSLVLSKADIVELNRVCKR